jgi:hypothetical protein
MVKMINKNKFSLILERENNTKRFTQIHTVANQDFFLSETFFSRGSAVLEGPWPPHI